MPTSDYSIPNIAVGNGGNLTVTGEWRVDAATVASGTAKVSGALSFGNGATIVVSGDINSVHQISFLVAKAASISGAPRLVGCEGWKVMVSGGELRLVKPGLSIIVR